MDAGGLRGRLWLTVLPDFWAGFWHKWVALAKMGGQVGGRRRGLAVLAAKDKTDDACHLDDGTNKSIRPKAMLLGLFVWA
jgi:hypothetical protein